MSKKHEKKDDSAKKAEKESVATEATQGSEKGSVEKDTSSLETEKDSQKKEPGCEEQKKDLEIKLKEMQDQYLRKAADFENYRKRMIREKQDAIDYANTNLLLDLVEVLDDFDRAIDSAKEAEQESPYASFIQGVHMIRDRLNGMLQSKYGLEYYPSKGEIFDPNIHEAVAMNPSADVETSVVGEELQKGYKLKDRTIRHAKVLVLMPMDGKEDEASSIKEKEENK